MMKLTNKNNGNSSSSNSKKKRMSKPLPLKQRTSSVDARRDYNAYTWYSVLGLLKLREFFVTVDHFSIWRRHLAWARENGKELRDYMTQRHASSMVFMSLLLSTELNILFNSSVITTNMRHSLQNEEYWRVEFWIGITIILSAVLTLLSLVSTYTAWSMVSCVDPSNAHCIFRSSIGQYVAELPGRLIVGSIYSFLLWVMMFFFVLLPVGYWSIALAVLSFLLFAHTICVLSAFGRIIMHSGAMGHQRIFEQTYERGLLPHSLHTHLLAKARLNLSKNTSILRQYRGNSRPIDGFIFSDDEEEGNWSDSYRGSSFSSSYQRQHSNEDYYGDDSITQAVSERTFSDGYGGGGSAFTDGYRESSQGSFRSQGSYSYGYYDGENNVDNYLPRAAVEEPTRRRADSTVRFADEVDLVTSSPRKTSDNTIDTSSVTRHTDSMNSLPEVDKPASLPTIGDATKTLRTSNRAASSEPNKSEPNDQGKPHRLESPRPGIVRRDRSNTTATETDFEALFRAPSPRRSPPPPKPKAPTLPPRAGSGESYSRNDPPSSRNSFNNAGRPLGDARQHSGDRRTSNGSLPPPSGSTSSAPQPPGLSVLENAAKMQRQWRNSYTSASGERSLPPPSPPSRRPLRSQSPVESEASLQQFWVNSSPNASARARKEFPVQQQQHQPQVNPSHTQGGPQRPPAINSSHNNNRAYDSNPNSPPPPPPPPPPPDIQPSMSHVSSSGALSSDAGGSDTNAGMSLSEEEEEAFARDYGSDAEDPWHQPSETASLLDHRGLERPSQSYMSVDDTAASRQRQG